MSQKRVQFPTEDITFAGLTPTPANDAIAAGKALLETPAFKKWFGDSKVRDLAKRPMVVYHGTCQAGFNRFDPTKTTEMGFHFGTPSQAKDFIKGCGSYRGNKPGVYPVYLSIQDPLFTPDLYSTDPSYFAQWMEKTNHIHDWFPDDNDSYYKSFNKLRDQRTESQLANDYKQVTVISKALWGLIRKIIMRKGYDGIRYKNENEGRTDDPSNIAWVAFSPAQVKSATANVGTFNRRDPDIRNPYTDLALRERLKRKIMAGDKGGRPGQWSARKAQLLANEYRKAGGGYTGKKSASQRSLTRWTRQDWRTKSGRPSLETGERYLPAKAIEALTPAEYAATTAAKRRAAGQFSRQPKRIAAKTAEYRNPMDPRAAMTQITGTEKTYAKAATMLKGAVLDYGAGYGIGTDVLRASGFSVDSYEPFPTKWKGKTPPTFTGEKPNIPSSAYDSVVSFSVLNVVDPVERAKILKNISRALRPGGVALITARTREDVEAPSKKVAHLEPGGFIIGTGKRQRYQKGFTQAELEQYARQTLGPEFSVEANKRLNGASIRVVKLAEKRKTNPMTRSILSRIIEPGDRVLCYDTAKGEDFYRLWDLIHTDQSLNTDSLREIEGMLDDDGVLVIESGEEPPGLRDHFRRAFRYQKLLLVQGPLNPEEARINTEKERRESE